MTLTSFVGDRTVQMQGVNSAIKVCKRCTTSTPCVHTYGRGSLTAKIMLIGESPWIKDKWLGISQETLDMLITQKYGEASSFGDAAGQWLSKILAALEIPEQDVYVTNMVKCSLPSNMKPARDQAEKCSKHLLSEISIVMPKLVLCASQVSRDWFKVDVGGAIKDIVFGCTFVGVYHPAYLNRSPDEFDKVVANYKKALRYLK